MRKIAPAIYPLQKIDFISPKIYDIENDVKLYWMSEVADDTAHLEFHFDAGTIQGEPGLASFVNALLLSGTDTKTSTQIQDELNDLGAFTDIEIGQEVAIINLFCLRENVERVVDIMADALENLAFIPHEVDDMLREKKQGYLVSSEKVSMLSRRAFQTQMFSNSERYGRISKETDFDRVSIPELKRFHKDHYLNGLTKIVVTANLNVAYIDRLIDIAGAWSKTEHANFEDTFINIPGEVHVEKEGAVQTAIRMGIQLFNKTHPDFLDFQVLQTIFGDYFGSRLMSNIREDKGYTYGIGCGVSESNKAGFFIIATEVGKEVATATIKEIQFEMYRLRTDPVGEVELGLVKNYLLGQILKSADGPDAMMGLFMGAQIHGKGYEYYNEAIESVKNVTAERLQELANKYLIWENFTLITAGEKV